MRRGVRMAYIVENNGVYGLTKGQFSPRPTRAPRARRASINSDSPVDLVAMALQLGATYVGAAFSGNKAQLVPLIKGAMSHGGAAFIDVISPCVAFNNHPGSTKSYDYVREHNEAGEPHRLHHAAQRDHRAVRARGSGRGRAARWFAATAAQPACGLRPLRTGM
jgi:pyruvate/2-oxoacid:ferredoxin oxidoreductase beta subunit